MKACGIIVEYNPFHNGHLYHAQKARELSGAEVVVACMSGNFLQRGEPAITDKWLRSRAALANGVDLVIELPLCWSLQAADYFAKGGIKILQAIGCQALCFGTDHQDDFDYQAFGRFAHEKRQAIDIAYRALHDEKLSYPQKMNQVFTRLYPEMQLSGAMPNHILGLAYAKENASYPHPMTLYPLPRVGAGYHDHKLSNQPIASATGIREAIAKHQSVSNFVPDQTLQSLQEQQVTWEKLWQLLRYRLLSTTAAELRQIYQMSDGLEQRMLGAVTQATSFSDFLQAVKSKRYTWTRLQRLCCYVLLNIQDQEMRQAWQEEQLRILGFNATGQAFLRQQKKQLTAEVVSRIGKPTTIQQELMVRGDQIYRLGDERVPEQTIGRIPIRI